MVWVLFAMRGNLSRYGRQVDDFPDDLPTEVWERVPEGARGLFLDHWRGGTSRTYLLDWLERAEGSEARSGAQ